jgi:hypothetical protein
MKVFIYRDVYTGKLYKAYAYNALEARAKIASLKNTKFFNLTRVKCQASIR